MPQLQSAVKHARFQLGFGLGSLLLCILQLGRQVLQLLLMRLLEQCSPALRLILRAHKDTHRLIRHSLIKVVWHVMRKQYRTVRHCSVEPDSLQRPRLAACERSSLRLTRDAVALPSLPLASASRRVSDCSCCWEASKLDFRAASRADTEEEAEVSCVSSSCTRWALSACRWHL